jgi:four helix bundle protein
MALGSLCEMETQLLIAFRLNYVDEETYQALSEGAAEVGRLLNGLIHSLSAR